mgnify:CR=1 FL=1
MEKILVTRSSMPLMEEYIEEIKELWDSHWLTNMGKKHRQLEAGLEQYLGVQNISLFTNGHMALELAIQAMGVSGEVITTPFTFASTTHAIVRNGLTPVFCDINPEDFTMDPGQVERLITDKTSAIIPVHVYGNICNVEEIEQIAKKHGLKVIYDAAHAFGVRYKDRGIGSYGDASMFSFHATKVYNSIEGGAVTFHDGEFGERLRKIRNFGIRSEGVIDSVGANAKMNEFQAAMGLCNLRHIDEEIEKRRKVHEKYVELLSGVKGIQLLKKQENVHPNYAYFPVVFHEKEFGASRDDVCEALEKDEIYARKYFYPLTSEFDCFHGKYDINETPVAHYISKRVLTLPMYADLKLEDVERICNIILKLNR